MEDYEIVELIAQGGYGIVLKAMQKSTGHMVAIKQFRDSDSFSLRIAEREISVLKLMQGHPNIIKLLNSFQHNSKVFLVFELMHQTLLEMLQASPEGKLGREQVRLIVYQMVKALAFMHAKNAVHRDIKPENMLLSRVVSNYNVNSSGNQSKRYRGHSVELISRENRDHPNDISQKEGDEESIIILKVCDLGQSREILEKDSNLTEYVSTRWYRAPELLVGSKIYEKSVDIWALGCIIPELITGNPLFPGKSNFETLAFIIRTFGNFLPEDQIQRFYENPEFKSIGKNLPSTKNAVSLEKRTPELTEEELDFVKSCLQMNPKLRPTAHQLLNHEYLNISQYPILQNYENTIQTELSSQQQIEVHNIAEIIEVSENYASVKNDDTNQIRFETDNEDLQISRCSNIESEIDQNVNNDSNKSVNPYTMSQVKKPKKRPSSSGQSNPSSNQDAKQNSNKQVSVLVTQDDNYGQEVIQTENNQSENNNQIVQEKQLPKPILFLRKQKEAREQPKSDQKMSESKIHPDSFMKSGYLQETGGDGPFELASEVINAQNNNAVSQFNQDYMGNQNRFSEPMAYERKNNNIVAKISRDKVQFNQPSQYQRADTLGGLVNSSHKQKRFQEKFISKDNRQSNHLMEGGQQDHPQQLYQIQKNKVLFSNLKNNLPQGRSPPVKLNNPKLLIQNMNQIQKNQANQQQNPKFIDLKMNQHKLKPNQLVLRNISQPHQQQTDDNMKMTAGSNFAKNSQYNNHSASKSPSQLSIGAGSTNNHQQDFLPQINREKFINIPLNNKNIMGKAQLLNTQKHVSNKLHLPSLIQNQIPQNNQNQPQSQNQDQSSYRKSASIKSINNMNQPSTNKNGQTENEYTNSFVTRIGTSYAAGKQEMELKNHYNQVRIPSRGLINIDSRGLANYQASQSHSPPHNISNQAQQNSREKKWYADYKQTQNDMKRHQIATNSQEKHPSRIPNENYNQNSNYINSPPKPISRNSLGQKKMNYQGSSQGNFQQQRTHGNNIAPINNNSNNNYNMTNQANNMRNAAKPPKR